jgi:oxalate decarboxylase/phosphoglucose isomerase-like protein (cupin superfamily)
MSSENDRPVVRDHRRKVNIEDVGGNGVTAPEAGKPGWIDMDVRWLVTRDTVGADESVFGVTYFPPGATHDIHRHENAEEVEYLIQGEGVARVGDDNVAMGAGDAVFVPRNDYHGFCNTSETETAVMVWCYAGAATLEEAGYITEAQDRGDG